MSQKYMLNTGTGMLHIVGYCCHTTKSKPNYAKYFETAEEAYRSGGRKVHPCTICEKEKEKRMEAEK